MNTTTILIGAGVAVAAYVAYQKFKPTVANPARPAVAPGVLDGGNWQGTMSQRLSAMDLIVPGFLNLGGGVNAIPSQNSAKAVGMNLLSNWQGNL